MREPIDRRRVQRWRGRLTRRVLAGAALVLIVAACATADRPITHASVAVPAGATQCVRSSARPDVDDLLANVYVLNPHEAVELPADPTWAEDPIGDPNWVFQLHSLRFVGWLIHAWRDSGDQRYLDRAEFLLQDWLDDNPREGAPSAFSWNDHATAQRAKILACAAEEITAPWMTAALQLHGVTLADPDFYVEVGNHAFQQGLGLLAVGCTLDEGDWIDLALTRMSDVATRSVDTQGVTNEQSVQYQLYNYDLYGEASDRLAACGVESPPGFERVHLMPEFLAHATLPNGEYANLGDSDVRRARRMEGTIAGFAATQGSAGPKPDTNMAIYDAGFVFARTGWGDDRPMEDEVFMSVRFGPPPILHGHADGGSVTLYGYGSRLVIDPGKYTYARGEWRDYFVSPEAHNVVVVDGVPAEDHVDTDLVSSEVTDDFVFVSLRRSIARGVSWERRVVFSMRGYVVVDDRISGADSQAVRQLWHLVDDADPTVSGNVVTTRRTSGNLAILQAAPIDEITTMTGDVDPIQGWLSYRYLERLPSPTIAAITTGSPARFVTVLYPSANGYVPKVTTEVDTDRLDLTIDADGYSEHITLHGDKATVTSIGT